MQARRLSAGMFKKTPWALALTAFGAVAPLAQAAGPIAVGPEFQVNTFTTNEQKWPVAAMDADGDFVVVWDSHAQDDPSDTSYNGRGVYAQRYNAAGVPQGAEFRVNSETSGFQADPSVAMDAAGNFVVVWSSNQEFGFSSTGIYAQRYNAAGVPQGPEFKVNSFTTSQQYNPDVAMDADGDFVVVWDSQGQDDPSDTTYNGTGVYAQRFNAAGVAQGGEFRVNTTTTGGQSRASIAMDQSGDFVVVWVDGEIGIGVTRGIIGQRFNAGGLAQGGEFQVNTSTTSPQLEPAVAMDADGDFVVAWLGYVESTFGVGKYLPYNFAQRYNATGAPQGSEILVGYTGTPAAPAVAMDTDGDFVVVTQFAFKYGGASELNFRRYTSSGGFVFGNFVNSFTTGVQTRPSVAMDADGDFVVAWQSEIQDGDSFGIFAQRFDEPEQVNARFAAPVLSGKSTSNTPDPGGEGPAGVYQFTARFCLQPGAGLTNLFSLTKQLSNNNSLISRTFSAPSGSPGGPGSVQDFPVEGDYSDQVLTSGQCADVLYRIGLASKAAFTFKIDVYGNLAPALP